MIFIDRLFIFFVFLSKQTTHVLYTVFPFYKLMLQVCIIIQNITSGKVDYLRFRRIYRKRQYGSNLHNCPLSFICHIDFTLKHSKCILSLSSSIKIYDCYTNKKNSFFSFYLRPDINIFSYRYSRNTLSNE